MDVLRQQSLYWPSVLAQALSKDMRGSVIVLGYVASGTNWLCRLVSEYLDMPIFEAWNRHSPTLAAHVFHLHRFVETQHAKRRTLYIHRDGRDAVISNYFKFINGPNSSRQRRNFEAYAGISMNPEKLREQLPAFIDWSFGQQQQSSIAWPAHVRRAIENGYPRVSFEGLKTSPVDTIAPALETITGSAIARERLARVVRNRDFSRVKTKTNAHFLRKGEAGEWRRTFNREACDRFAYWGQEELEALGYEQDTGWVDVGATSEGASC